MAKRSGNEMHKLYPVKGFMPHYDLEKDEHYQALIEGMADYRIEFAKALVLTGGVQSRAVQIVFPDYPQSSYRKRASQLAQRGDVQAVFTYLRGLRNPNVPNLNREQLVEDMERDYLTCEVARERHQFRMDIMRLRGWDKAPSNPDQATLPTDAETVLNELLGTSIDGTVREAEAPVA